MAKGKKDIKQLDDDFEGMDDQAEEQTDEAETVSESPTVKPFDVDQPNRQGDNTRPACPVHNCLMTANGTTPEVTRYRCPVDDCDQREVRVRPNVRVPAKPTPCPSASHSANGKEVFLIVSTAHKEAAHLTMVCPDPDCGFSIKVPRPAFQPPASSREYLEGRNANNGER